MDEVLLKCFQWRPLQQNLNTKRLYDLLRAKHARRIMASAEHLATREEE
jgi:hypothetical protein